MLKRSGAMMDFGSATLRLPNRGKDFQMTFRHPTMPKPGAMQMNQRLLFSHAHLSTCEKSVCLLEHFSLDSEFLPKATAVVTAFRTHASSEPFAWPPKHEINPPYGILKKTWFSPPPNGPVPKDVSPPSAMTVDIESCTGLNAPKASDLAHDIAATMTEEGPVVPLLHTASSYSGNNKGDATSCSDTLFGDEDEDGRFSTSPEASM